MVIDTKKYCGLAIFDMLSPILSLPLIDECSTAALSRSERRG